jgi:DNA transformation protein
MAKPRKPPDPFAQAVVTRLTPLGEVRARPMFGGYGFYADDLFFGLFMGGQLYFKIDDGNRAIFESRGIELFRPVPDRPDFAMRYCKVPPDVFDGPDLIAWAEGAVGAARRDRDRRKLKNGARSASSRR